MLISIPTETSAIFGAFQAIFGSPRLRRNCATKQSYVRHSNDASFPFEDAAAHQGMAVGSVPQIPHERAPEVDFA
jgi:hypothetical protein